MENTILILAIHISSAALWFFTGYSWGKLKAMRKYREELTLLRVELDKIELKDAGEA